MEQSDQAGVTLSAGAVRRTTSHDVARLAGVSQPTVSRALRNHPQVPEATRARVREAADTLGYVPNQLGRSLSTQATQRVAMVADLENPLYPILLGPVHDRLAEAGYRTVLFAERSKDEGAYDALFDRSIDGVILSTASLRSSLPLELDRRGVPFVFLNRTHDQVERDSATADDLGGAAQVADLLLRLGHRRIAALLGPETTSTSRARERGLRTTLAEGQVAIPDRWCARTDYTVDSGAAAFRRLVSDGGRPTAVFCVNDHVAVGALNAARALGIGVPGDITIVGFDDLPIASWPTFNLTTVLNPLADSARRAAELLLDRLSGTPPLTYQHLVAATSLVLRGTHGPAPAAPPGSRARARHSAKPA